MSVSLVKIPRALPSDAGCWIDGHWGQYATARLVQIAAGYGFRGDAVEDPEADLARIARAHLASIGPSDSEGISDDEHETLVYGADDAEAWLNAHVAPEGFSFGWHDGEFFLWSDETWEEDAY